MDATILFWLAPIGSLLAIACAYNFYSSIEIKSSSNEKAKRIAAAIKKGSETYLLSQFKVLSLVFIVIFAVFAFLAFVLEIQSPWTSLAFLSGALFSAISSYIGMKSANKTSLTLAESSAEPLNSSVKKAFKGAYVLGFAATGLCILDISIWWKVLNYVFDNKEIFKDSIFEIKSYAEITSVMLTFAMGSSLMSFISGLSGGIFSKASNLALTLVKSSENKGDSESESAEIMSNIGSNASDISGTTSNIYESYACSILAASALGARAFGNTELVKYQLNSIALPLVIASFGVVSSLLALNFIKVNEGGTPKDMVQGINRSKNLVVFLNFIAAIILINLFLPNNFKLIGSVLIGLVVGLIIDWSSNYYTSEDFIPTQDVFNEKTTAPIALLESASLGFSSTKIPTMVMCFGLVLSYGFAEGFSNPVMGLYSIGITIVSMLSTAALTLASVAYSSIANNASSIVKLSDMPTESIKNLSTMASIGDRIKPSNKAVIIASAFFTLLALAGAYIEEIRFCLLKISNFSNDSLSKYIFPSSEKAVEIGGATLQDFVSSYNINLLNPMVLVGIFIGSMFVLAFAASIMKIANKATIVLTNKNQEELEGNIRGNTEDESEEDQNVSRFTYFSLKSIFWPFFATVALTIIVGLLLNLSGVLGMFIGLGTIGVIIATAFSNSGSALSNGSKSLLNPNPGNFAIASSLIGNSAKEVAATSIVSATKFIGVLSIVFAGIVANYSSSTQNIFALNPTELVYKSEYAKKNNLDTFGEKRKLQDYSSSLYEDPLLGTEDIILPSDEDMLRTRVELKETSSPKPTVTKSATKVKETKAEGGFDSGFGDGFGGGFNSAFEDTKPKEGKEEKTEGGFDSGFGDGFGGGFDSAFEDTKPKEGKEEKTEGGFDSGFGDGFGGGFDSAFEDTKTKEGKEEKTEGEPNSTQKSEKTETSEVTNADPKVEVKEKPTTEEIKNKAENTNETLDTTSGFDAF